MLFAVILLILTYSVIIQIYSSNLFYIIIMSSLSSICFTILYLYFKSPDVAVTEATIGSSVSIIISMILLSFIKEKHDYKINQLSYKNKINLSYSFLICLILAYILIYSYMNEFFNFNSQELTEPASYYIDHTEKDYNGLKNIVTGILGGYRSFDSFLELCVIVFGANLIGKILSKND